MTAVYAGGENLGVEFGRAARRGGSTRGDGRRTRNGSAAWYVPEGAEFDVDIHHDPAARRRVLLARVGLRGLDNPWFRSPEVIEDLLDFEARMRGDEMVLWDEVEDFDERTPHRVAVRTLLGEFEDLCATIGVELPGTDYVEADDEPAPVPSPTKTVGRAGRSGRPRPKPEPKPEPAPVVDLDAWEEPEDPEPIAPPTPTADDRRRPRRQPTKLSRKAKKRAKKALASAPRAIAPEPVREAVEEPATPASYGDRLRRVWAS